MVGYSTLRLCRNRAGYETEPVEQVTVDIADVKVRASGTDLEPLVDAGTILVLKWGRVELSLFATGKMLFKTRDPAEALGAMKAVVDLLGWEWTAPEVEART